MSKQTPMMQQYLKIKEQYADAFLFFRLGDFYEMFFDDAILAARELEITLTKRDSGQSDPIPMCGVPHHSAESYIQNLVEKGYKIAICEQVEDPKTAKGVVKREVVQLITPGTVMETNMLNESENNFLASLTYFENGNFVIAYNDLTTGETNLALIEDGWDGVIHELYNQPIKEIVIQSSLKESYQQSLKTELSVTLSYEDDANFHGEYRDLCEDLLDEQFIEAFSRMLNYVHTTQKRSLEHMQPAKIIQLDKYLKLDKYSKRNLELTETLIKKEKHGSLLWVLDKTVTAMGSRLLKKWLERPLLKQHEIENRLDITEGFYQDFLQREEIREALKSVYDLERLVGRISYGNANAKDLIQLKASLSNIPIIKDILSASNEKKIQQISKQLNELPELVSLLEASIVDNPPMSITEGGLIKIGYDAELDTYLDASKNGKTWIAELEQKEKEATKIKSLKVGFNKVFGYYIEITRANIPLIPEGRYERKQTLANAERYITPELKEKEQLILEAEDKSVALEYQLFLQIREQTKAYIAKIQDIAKTISEIDVLQSFAKVSEENGYKRPNFVKKGLNIRSSRHPVIEKVLTDGSFVPNDITFSEKDKILLITGPNMSGKSTYMRQAALTVIMGQIGCFVACEEAELSVMDQIFTRIGAADDLVAGKSTFMVEMLETNHAIEHATERSLILLDEIGRGTSTYDGMALAQAIIEYIHEKIGAYTLFSTHYHELTTLENSLTHLKNIHVRAEEHNGHVVFLHQIKDGAADESYGIHVAKLASLPDELIDRASIILEQLETSNTNYTTETSAQQEPEVYDEQLSFFATPKSEPKNQTKEADMNVLQELGKMDVLDMTPLDALNALYRLKKDLSK